MTPETQCGAHDPTCLYVCDRENGHLGNHRGYNDQHDEAVFWADSSSLPWICVMDFPTAWAFIREQHPDPTEHDPRCSWVQAKGGVLCDCHVLMDEYNRRKRAPGGQR